MLSYLQMLTDNKENVNVEGGGSVKDSIKGKMTEEQDLLRVSYPPTPTHPHLFSGHCGYIHVEAIVS